MDIHLCIDHLGLNNNSYRLNQSNPPHIFVSWSGPDPQPTNSVLEGAWAEIQNNSDYQAHIADTKKMQYPLGETNG